MGSLELSTFKPVMPFCSQTCYTNLFTKLFEVERAYLTYSHFIDQKLGTQGIYSGGIRPPPQLDPLYVC